MSMSKRNLAIWGGATLAALLLTTGLGKPGRN